MVSALDFLKKTDDGNQLRENLWLGPVVRMGGAVGSVPAHIARDPGSNASSGENLCLKIRYIGPTRLLF